MKFVSLLVDVGVSLLIVIVGVSVFIADVTWETPHYQGSMGVVLLMWDGSFFIAGVDCKSLV